MKDHIDEIVGRGGGGKKGGGGESAENTLRSSATARIVEAISEGPIVGLIDGSKSVFLDETPLRNEFNGWNFKNVSWQQRRGTPDQTHVNGHGGVESLETVEVEVKKATGDVTRTINDPNADAVRVVIRVDSLFKIDDEGKAQVNTLRYRIHVRPFGGAWTTAVYQKLDREKTTSAVQMAHRIELPLGGHPWDIRVERVSSDSTDDKDQKSFTFESFTTLVEGRFTYPHTALIAMKVDAETVGSTIPQRAYEVMGRIISVPSNYDSEGSRAYTGVWDGTFKQAWTNNPAWIFYDLLVNDRYGLGEFISDAEVASLKWKLYTIGQYCDQLVPSGFKDDSAQDIMERRFTFNGVIRNRQEAYHVLASITTAFRGMGYWALGQVFATADMPADPVKLVTPANVIGGRFNYSSTASKARHSVAIVKWNNPDLFFRTDTEVVVNDDALHKLGWREKRLDLPGCTSRGLAHRYGKWALDVENTETETVEYKASFDHMDIVPGDIISIADPRKASVRMGGRIVAHTVVDGSTDEIELDAAVAFQNGETYKIWLTKPDGTLTECDISSYSPDMTKVQIATEAVRAEADTVFVITASNLKPRQYRVLTINEAEENIFQITALFHDPTKYARIEQNVSFEPIPYNVDLSAQPVQNLTVDEIAYIDENGVARTKTRLSWSAPSGVIVREYVVQADTPTDKLQFITSTKNTTVDLTDLDRGDHVFHITTVDRMGRVSVAASIPHTVTVSDSISTGAVSNLKLTDSNGSTEFFGRDVRVQWQNLYPSVSGGPADKENAALYDFNTVKVYDHGSNTLLRTEIVRGNTYTYSFDYNQRDCTTAALSVVASRNLRFEVTNTSKRANVSPTTTLTVSNPVPSAVVPAIAKSGHNLNISLPSTADPDIRGMKVWVETSSGFDPNVATPKFDSTATFVTWPGLPNTTYHIRAGYYDHFDDTVSLSAEISVTTDSTLVGVAPATPTGLALSTELLDNGRSRITATWDANSEPYLSHYDLLVAENGGNEIGHSTVTTQFQWDVLPGASLSIRVRAVSDTNKPSSYTAAVVQSAAKDNIAPATPTGLTLTAGLGTIWAEWNANVEPDLDHYEVSILDTNANPERLDIPATFDEGKEQWREAGVTSLSITTKPGGTITDLPEGKSLRLSSQKIILSSATALPVDTTRSYRITIRHRLTTAHSVNGMGRIVPIVGYYDAAGTRITPFDQIQITDNIAQSADFIDYSVDYTPLATHSSQATVSWKPAFHLGMDSGTWDAGDGVVDILSFKIEDITSGQIILDVPGTALVRSGLPNATEKFFSVRAVDTSGNASNWTPLVAATTDDEISAIPPDGSITEVKIASDAITAPKLAAGAVTASKLTSGELITLSAQIKDAIITNAKIASLSAAKLQAGTALTSSLTVDGTALSTVGQRAADPAARINGVATQIDPGKILISGSTSLADWRDGGDATKIDGGNISANSITANQLSVGLRGFRMAGIAFEANAPVDNDVSWTAGEIHRTKNDGTQHINNISAGSASWTAGNLFVYWNLTYPNILQATTDPLVAYGDETVVVAIYNGGTNLTTDVGRTIIDGAFLKTETIEAQHIVLKSITGDQIANTTIDGGMIVTESIGSTEIAAQAIEADKINAEAVTADKIAADAINASHIAAGEVTASKITVDETLDIDAQDAGFRMDKQNVADFANDGVYMGRHLDGGNNPSFGFFMGSTVNGVEQYVRLTKEDGLKIKNAEYLIGSGIHSDTTYTSSQTVSLAGKKTFSAQLYGGGGGGRGGTAYNSAGGNNGGNGGNTVLQLYDGAVLKATWTANGGAGGSSTHSSSQSGQTSSFSPYGNSGGGGSRGSRKQRTWNDRQASWGSWLWTYGKYGDNGIKGGTKTISNYDISSFADPKIVVTVGGGGAGGAGGGSNGGGTTTGFSTVQYQNYKGGNGASGSAGAVKVQTSADTFQAAGPIAVNPTANGTFASGTGVKNFPSILPGRGFWTIICFGSNITINPGANWVTAKAGQSTSFFSQNTPIIQSSSANSTVYYTFRAM
jgi:predicted phage tail protein